MMAGSRPRRHCATLQPGYSPSKQYERKLIYRSTRVHFGLLQGGMRTACLALVLANIATILPSIGAQRLVKVDLAQSRVDVVVRASVDSFTAQLKRFEPVVK